MENPHLSISETAKIIGVTVETLRRWDELGKFKPSFISPGKHRYYTQNDINLFLKDVFSEAKTWSLSTTPSVPPNPFYCHLKPVFHHKLERFQEELQKMPEYSELYSLIVGVTAEIGNNSFDHNLGNWPDISGIFFGYDLNKRKIALADRGRGVLTTLKNVRPELNDHQEALKVAFTEVVTGRAPENRGNGLKFVSGIIAEYPMNLHFYSGNALVTFQKGSVKPLISHSSITIQGCLALIEF